VNTILENLTRKDGPIDRARQVQERIGARPYRVWLCWSKWPEEIGEGREQGPCRYEIRPRPKVLGYTGITRNPTLIGVVPEGSLRLTEVPLWLPFDALRGKLLPEKNVAMAGPEKGVRFWYEVGVDSRDETQKPQSYRLNGEPERDEEGAQWLIVLERQATQDRK